MPGLTDTLQLVALATSADSVLVPPTLGSEVGVRAIEEMTGAGSPATVTLVFAVFVLVTVPASRAKV